MKIFLQEYKRDKRPKLPLMNYLIKIFNKKEMSHKQFHHCLAKIFLEKFTKSINSQTNIKSSGNVA